MYYCYYYYCVVPQQRSKTSQTEKRTIIHHIAEYKVPGFVPSPLVPFAKFIAKRVLPSSWPSYVRS